MYIKLIISIISCATNSPALRGKTILVTMAGTQQAAAARTLGKEPTAACPGAQLAPSGGILSSLGHEGGPAVNLPRIPLEQL